MQHDFLESHCGPAGEMWTGSVHWSLTLHQYWFLGLYAGYVGECPCGECFVVMKHHVCNLLSKCSERDLRVNNGANTVTYSQLGNQGDRHARVLYTYLETSWWRAPASVLWPGARLVPSPQGSVHWPEWDVSPTFQTHPAAAYRVPESGR